MAIDILTKSISKKYTNLVALGLATASVDDVNKSITFTLASDGSQHTIHFNQPSNGKDGISVTGVADKGNGVFTLLLSDGSETDPIQCVKGEDGFSPTATVEKVGKVATITITDVNGTTTATIKDGEGSEGGEANTIDSISVNGINVVPDENKNVDITVPSIDGLAKTEDIPTKVSELTNDSGYLTEHQDISGKVDKVDGKSLIADTEIERLASVDNYDDTEVKSQIQAVANGLMDSVGYSADYKTIDIIAKNGVKKSVNVAPIISHASITELSDVDTTNKATGKALVYNATTSKHEYADVSGTDEKVKMDASTDAKYLGELLDNVTITNENGALKVKKLDGQEVTITEINYLKGLTMNVMDLVNMFANGGVKIINTPVATYAELLTIDKSSFIEGISYLVYVLADENHDNAKTTYLVDKDSEIPTYFGFADSQRDFTTNPIDLATEITGKLGIANMDSDAIKALFTVDDTYKTETATNNAFSTHGAKALYDELLLAIGNKANDSDLTAHKDDANIHVSTEDRTKWDSAKTHADSAHAPSNAQENVLETVKINNQEITPDENKAVNIDLSDYAKKTDIPTTLPANGGNADTVNNHTVKSDVPENAVFTDTIYDDTEVKGSIEDLSSNLDELSYSDNGIENLCNPNKIERGLYTSTDTRGENYFHYEIEVTPNEYYSRTRFDGLTDYSGYCFSVLDENKNCIVVFANNERTIQIPSNGAYLWLQGGESAEQLKNMKYMVVKLQTPPTDYKPYIPSVKMIAEENEQQNTEAMDLKMLGWNVPRECPIQNEVSGNQFIQKVGRVDLGSLEWNYATNPNRFNADFNSVKFVDTSTPIVAYSTKYDIYSFNTAIKKDKAIGVWGSNSIASFLVALDSSYTDATTFKNAMKGVYLYYELATPITKTIDGNEAVEELSSNLNDLVYGDNGGYNIFKDTTWVVGRHMAENGINDYPETGSAYSDYISIVEPNTYYISSFTHPKSTVFEYDANKSFIKYNGWKKDNNTPCVLSGNCAYIRISFNGASSNIQPSNVMLAKTPNLPYKPYIPSVKMLAEEVGKQNDSLSSIGKCKNLLNPTLQTTTLNGVTCTAIGDGTYTINGTASADAVFELESYKPYTGNEIFRLVGCPSGGSASTYYLGFRPRDAEENRKDIGSGVTFNDLSTSNVYAVAIIVLNGTTVTNLTFKPMLTENLNATYDDFVPYTGDGETLTHDVAELKNDLSVKKFELVAGALWLCVSGKHCVLTLNGYNLTESTHFDKLEEYQPYLVARNVVSKGDSVCIAAVEPNGNINASDLVVGTQLTGQLFGEISWIANI